VDAVLAGHGIVLPGGRVTALLLPRVLGWTFNPLSLFWCHGDGGKLRCVIAEVQNDHGERHAYFLPAPDAGPAMVTKMIRTSPFGAVDGHYLVREPRPADTLDLTVSSHRENLPAAVTTWPARGEITAPFAAHMAALSAAVRTVPHWNGSNRSLMPS
jgi:DUF1365 family protein